jgi:hypothetical protein
MSLPKENVYTDVCFIPAKTTPRFSALITIHTGVSAIHLESFIEHNEDADVYVISDNRPSTEQHIRYTNWKTCDTLLREWWKDNGKKRKIKKLLFMEYDVLITTKITDDMFTDGLRITHHQYFKDDQPGYDVEDSWQYTEGWYWYRVDGDRFPLRLKKTAGYGMVSIAWYDASALDFLIRAEWDDIFKRDILCEMRIITILNYHKVPLYNWDINHTFIRNSAALINIEYEPEVVNRIKNLEPGIYHPVKTAVKDFTGIV